jgi:hypothetical protein
MIGQEILDSQIEPDRFPIPSEGDITLAVHNANYTLGPVMLRLTMKPGAIIRADLHKKLPKYFTSLRATSSTRASSTRLARRCI